MKKLVLVVLIFSMMMSFTSGCISHQVMVRTPFITIEPTYYSQPTYMMEPAPYPDRYNSYRTGSYEDYYLPPSPYPPPGLHYRYPEYPHRHYRHYRR